MTECTAPAQPLDLPLDSPLARQTWRIYAALTNHCNRDCPWCSTCSSPRGKTWLSIDQLRTALAARGAPEMQNAQEGQGVQRARSAPAERTASAAPAAHVAQDAYELQLEGGEPLLHPDFDRFVAFARGDPRCAQLVVCTNGTTLPRDTTRLTRWLQSLGHGAMVKLSFNHHLLERDPGLPQLARQLLDGAAATGVKVVINVRLRRGEAAGQDAAVLDAARRQRLLDHANVFDLQRYGFAADEAGWDLPHVVSDRFSLLNPDGAVFTDLVARSEAMRALP